MLVFEGEKYNLYNLLNLILFWREIVEFDFECFTVAAHIMSSVHIMSSFHTKLLISSDSSMFSILFGL